MASMLMWMWCGLYLSCSVLTSDVYLITDCCCACVQDGVVISQWADDIVSAVSAARVSIQLSVRTGRTWTCTVQRCMTSTVCLQWLMIIICYLLQLLLTCDMTAMIRHNISSADPQLWSTAIIPILTLALSLCLCTLTLTLGFLRVKGPLS